MGSPARRKDKQANPKKFFLPTCKLVLAIFRVHFLIKVIKKIPCRCAQQLVSELIPEPVRLTTKLNHQDRALLLTLILLELV